MPQNTSYRADQLMKIGPLLLLSLEGLGVAQPIASRPGRERGGRSRTTMPDGLESGESLGSWGWRVRRRRRRATLVRRAIER